ncbi:MAG: response regulator [Pseudomonadota bacterium]|nr:response regulator [Pseudomonadota bacterium]
MNQAWILVAEDEPFIALDLALAVEDAGGRVVGPAASVKEALTLLESMPVAGAILDVTLADKEVTPVAKFLIAHCVPLVVQTGVGLPPGMAARFPDLIVRIKPCGSTELVEQLAALIGDQREVA